MEHPGALSKTKKIIPKKNLHFIKKLLPKNFLYFGMKPYLTYYHHSLLSLKSFQHTPKNHKKKHSEKIFYIFLKKVLSIF